MANKKKVNKTATKQEKELEKQVEILEKTLQQIKDEQQLEERIANIKNSIKEDLKNQLISQNKFGKHFDDMIEDYLYFFELKERLKFDINMNGIRYMTTGGNGFTTFKANESVERLQKTNAQMLKILQDLELKEPEEAPEEGEGDDLL